MIVFQVAHGDLSGSGSAPRKIVGLFTNSGAAWDVAKLPEHCVQGSPFHPAEVEEVKVYESAQQFTDDRRLAIRAQVLARLTVREREALGV